jgi:hypothetical protein
VYAVNNAGDGIRKVQNTDGEEKLARMKDVDYRSERKALEGTETDPDHVLRFARKVANSFMDRYFQDGTYRADYIALLCEMATRLDAPVLNLAASKALFGVIIEQLCDDLEERQQDVYNRVIAQVIDYCRKLPDARPLDEQLRRFGIFSWEDLYCRANAVQQRNLRWDPTRAPRRIFILSRATIGADVAIVSVLIQRMAQLFTESEIILFGGDKLDHLFGGNPRLKIQTLNYSRRGGILERFQSWEEAAKIIEGQVRAMPGEDYVIIDPDSRITQLGVLPLANMSNYLFMNTRRDEGGPGYGSMAEITNQWVDFTFGKARFAYPRVWLKEEVISEAEKLLRTIRRGSQCVAVINFGVGGNTRKRLGIEFETKLLLELLKEPGTSFILDRGFGDDEKSAGEHLLSALAKAGYTSKQLSFGEKMMAEDEAKVFSVDCNIGQIAALIRKTDEFVGYDSACQHIAAALGIPTITVFAGTNNPRFIRRWSASGQGCTSIVHVNTLSDSKGLDYNEVVERVIHERSKRRKKIDPN